MGPITTTTLGLFAHYRPVLLAMPQGGCLTVATFLDAGSPQELSERLEGAGLLYRHPHWGPAVSELLGVALDQPTLSGLPAELFPWNSEATIVVEPLRLMMLQAVTASISSLICDCAVRRHCWPAAAGLRP
jgi:hypothetical protein